MAIFEERPEEWNRLDFRLLRDHPVTLYFRRTVLEEDSRWFEAQGYRLHRFDAAKWSTLEKFHDDMTSGLQFPAYYGRNLDAFNDCLSEIDIPNVGGTALVLVAFDTFAARFPKQAWTILDIIATHSRRALLFGRRLLALVQSDNPKIQLQVIGATPIGWNPQERLNKHRGL